MFKPDYAGNSIVNLMGSITGACGGRPLHPTLRDHDTADWAGQHIVLLVLDGLGWDILQSYGAGSFLARHAQRRMTSVFPSTTAAAITTYQSGLTPLQHAMTGWFVWLKELGTAAPILLAKPRWGDAHFNTAGIDYHEIYRFAPLFPQLQRDCAIVSPAYYKGSDFSTHTTGDARWYGYRSLAGCMRQAKHAVASAKGHSFTYVYWPMYDSLCHKHGSYSAQAKEHFATLDAAVERLAASLKSMNVRLLASADHGFCNVPPQQQLHMESYPDLNACLNIPLCGEPRVPYAYVKPAQAALFEELVRHHLGHCCTLVTRRQALEQGWYGTGEPNPAWADRVGDYILLMHDGWTLSQQVLGEHPPVFVGYHGGASELEMHVPLFDLAP